MAADQPLRAQSGLMTSPEAAEYLRLSARTLEGMRVDGTGPRYYKVGPGRRAKVVYRVADLEEWLQQFQFGSTSEYEA
ncbi:MAG: helix-turn-helix domain-containing protein [Hyphomicrobiaceae bacterium]